MSFPRSLAAKGTALSSKKPKPAKGMQEGGAVSYEVMEKGVRLVIKEIPLSQKTKSLEWNKRLRSESDEERG